MKRLFISIMILFFLVFFVSCSGVTTPTTPETVPDDGGMGSYDYQFISLLNELYNPLELMYYLIDNFQYKQHDGRHLPYEFYLKKEGDCGDYACFNCYVLHYNNYVVNFVHIAFLNEYWGHFITVFEHKNTDQYWGYPNLDKYGYFSNHKLILAATPPLDSIQDCVDDYMERWGSGHSFDYYNVYPWNFFNYKQ